MRGTPQNAGAGPSQRWSIAASASSIISALAASLCCIGPLVFALLGLGGAGLLLKLEPYRPYFTAATLALLGTGFYLTYRKPKAAAAASEAECDCPAPRASRAGKIMLWVSTVLVLAFLAFPLLMPYLVTP